MCATAHCFGIRGARVAFHTRDMQNLLPGDHSLVCLGQVGKHLDHHQQQRAVKASRHCRVYSDKIRFMPWESPRCTSGTTLTAENKDVGLCPVCFKTGLRVD